jgi:uncharacterized protein
MEPRISIITLGVKDLARSTAFYKEGLDFPTTRSAADGIVFFQTTGTCFALYPYDKLAEEIPGGFIPPHDQKPKFPGITLAHNVRNKEEVDQVLQLAKNAGGRIEKPAQDVFWGGHSGYFSDPDGYLWEVAWGAFEFNEDGSLKIT